MTVSLVTCISNWGGSGPGHSCIDVNGTIYTFEGKGMSANSTAWLVYSRSSYLKLNTHRPVIFQELAVSVDTKKALTYIKNSTANFDKYALAGVCSSQAASVIEHAWGKTFNTSGIDKPYEIYDLVKTKKLVVRQTAFWPGKKDCNIVERNGIGALLWAVNRGYSWVF